MSSPSDSSQSTFLHPGSGALILALDWLLFSGSVITLGLSTPALITFGFVVGTAGTAAIQWKFAGDGLGKSLGKGILSGLVIGIPLPIAGTAAGGAILAMSGLNRIWDRKDESSDSDARK